MSHSKLSSNDNYNYHIEARNKSNYNDSCLFYKSEIVSIQFVRSSIFVRPHLCIICLKSDVEIKFNLHTWDIYQYSDDGSLFINGQLTQDLNYDD